MSLNITRITRRAVDLIGKFYRALAVRVRLNSIFLYNKYTCSIPKKTLSLLFMSIRKI